jgi:hypothetical protein
MSKSLFALLLGVLLLSSCDNSNNNTNSNTALTNQNVSPIVVPPEPIHTTSTPDPNYKSCNPYFPLVPGSEEEYTLSFSTGLVATQKVVTDQAQENGKTVFVERTQIVDKSGGAEKKELTTRKYLCDGERIQIIYEKNENEVQRQQTTFTHKYKDATYVMPTAADLTRKGATWTYSFTQTLEKPGEPAMELPDPVFVSCEAQGEEEVTVPAGKYQAIKVTKKIKENYVVEYYARGIGLVKRVSKDGTTLELKGYAGMKAMP